jgi:endonuclease YncB( thermonuclease family)
VEEGKINKQQKVAIFIGVIIILGLVLWFLGKEPGPDAGEADTYLVKRVIDGDTVVLENGEKIRYQGVDTPEKAQDFNKEATAKNRELVDGKRIRLEHDVTLKDRFGRHLGYVFVGDTFVNAELVRLGLARVFIFEPNVKYEMLFKNMQLQAQSAKRGIWSSLEKGDEAYYWATGTSKRYHRPNCKLKKKVNPNRIIKFNTRLEAEQRGYYPCKLCNP